MNYVAYKPSISLRMNVNFVIFNTMNDYTDLCYTVFHLQDYFFQWMKIVKIVQIRKKNVQLF